MTTKYNSHLRENLGNCLNEAAEAKYLQFIPRAQWFIPREAGVAPQEGFWYCQQLEVPRLQPVNAPLQLRPDRLGLLLGVNLLHHGRALLLQQGHQPKARAKNSLTLLSAAVSATHTADSFSSSALTLLFPAWTLCWMFCRLAFSSFCFYFSWPCGGGRIILLSPMSLFVELWWIVVRSLVAGRTRGPSTSYPIWNHRPRQRVRHSSCCQLAVFTCWSPPPSRMGLSE